MKDKTLENLWIGLIIALIFTAFIFSMYRVDTLSFSYDDYCHEKYGEGWFRETHEHYGNYCIEIDNKTFEILDTEILPPFKEVKEYCGVPKFFSFEAKERCK